MNILTRRKTARLSFFSVIAVLLCLVLLVSSCKKEEPVDRIVSVNMTVRISAPSALLNVADVEVVARTSRNIVSKVADSPDWSYVFPLTGESDADTAMPVHLDVSMKGKDVGKGTPIDAGVSYLLNFDTLFESGKTEHIATFEQKNAARIVWISSTGKYGSLMPLDFSWYGDLKKDETSSAGYTVNDLL